MVLGLQNVCYYETAHVKNPFILHQHGENQNTFSTKRHDACWLAEVRYWIFKTHQWLKMAWRTRAVKKKNNSEKPVLLNICQEDATWPSLLKCQITILEDISTVHDEWVCSQIANNKVYFIYYLYELTNVFLLICKKMYL